MPYPFRNHARKVLGGLAIASLPASASAQSYSDRGVEPYGSAGMYLTYAFGAAQPWGFGVEARVGVREERSQNCEIETGAIAYGGGALRLEWFPSNHTRLLIVGQAGHSFASIMGAHGELGVGYRWGEEAGFDTVIGAELDIAVAAFALHFDPTRMELSPSAGFLFPSNALPLTTVCAVPGRPLRSADGFAPLPMLAMGGSRMADHAPREVARIWGGRAQAEWASLPAFRELASHLAAFDAPRSLVTRCHAAFADELRHALLAGGHCASLGEGQMELIGSAASARMPLAGSPGLVRLAVESWVDGCLGEGAAAACAAEEARLAARSAIRSTQQTIAADEAQHAELAWDVVQWALEVGGDDTRAALHAASRARPTDPSADERGYRLEEYGILSPEQRHAVIEKSCKHSVQRLDRVLAA